MDGFKEFYMLTDEDEGEDWGEFSTIEEAVELAKLLRERSYYILLIKPDRRCEIAVDTPEMDKLLGYDEENSLYRSIRKMKKLEKERK